MKSKSNTTYDGIPDPALVEHRNDGEKFIVEVHDLWDPFGESTTAGVTGGFAGIGKAYRGGTASFIHTVQKTY